MACTRYLVSWRVEWSGSHGLFQDFPPSKTGYYEACDYASMLEQCGFVADVHPVYKVKNCIWEN